MMSREKPNAPRHRAIIDLFSLVSLRAGIAKDQYLGNPFIIKLLIINNITNKIKALGKSYKPYKVDISRAFRHIKLDPKEYNLLGLHNER